MFNLYIYIYMCIILYTTYIMIMYQDANFCQRQAKIWSRLPQTGENHLRNRPVDGMKHSISEVTSNK